MYLFWRQQCTSYQSVLLTPSCPAVSWPREGMKIRVQSRTKIGTHHGVTRIPNTMPLRQELSQEPCGKRTFPYIVKSTGVFFFLSGLTLWIRQTHDVCAAALKSKKKLSLVRLAILIRAQPSFSLAKQGSVVMFSVKTSIFLFFHC